MLEMPLIVGGARGGAPPKCPSCQGFCLLIDGGSPAVWKQSVTVYIIVVITKIIAMTKQFSPDAMHDSPLLPSLNNVPHHK